MNTTDTPTRRTGVRALATFVATGLAVTTSKGGILEWSPKRKR